MRFTKTIAMAAALTVGALAFAESADARPRQERIWRHHGGHHHHHHFHHGHRGHFASGAFGFAAGAILGSALSRPYYYAPAPVYVAPAPVYVYQPWTPGWYTYCGGKYRSFNASTGYFLGYDGQYHFCR